MRLKIEVVAGALAWMRGRGFPAATPETVVPHHDSHQKAYNGE
jgi:hypothetical protein